MKQFADDTSPWMVIVLWAFLGLVGGLVKNCEELKPYSWKRMLSSLISSAFAGSAGAAILMGYIDNPMVLGGASAMFGYFGQLTLVVGIKIAKRKLGI